MCVCLFARSLSVRIIVYGAMRLRTTPDRLMGKLDLLLSLFLLLQQLLLRCSASTALLQLYMHNIIITQMVCSVVYVMCSGDIQPDD